jgi:hypothetical protein
MCGGGRLWIGARAGGGGGGTLVHSVRGERFCGTIPLTRGLTSQPAEAPAAARRGFLICKARWQSGHAAACKAVYAGSIPTLASMDFHWRPQFSTHVRFKVSVRAPERHTLTRFDPSSRIRDVSGFRSPTPLIS